MTNVKSYYTFLLHCTFNFDPLAIWDPAHQLSCVCALWSLLCWWVRTARKAFWLHTLKYNWLQENILVILLFLAFQQRQGKFRHTLFTSALMDLSKRSTFLKTSCCWCLEKGLCDWNDNLLKKSISADVKRLHRNLPVFAGIWTTKEIKKGAPCGLWLNLFWKFSIV